MVCLGWLDGWEGAQGAYPAPKPPELLGLMKEVPEDMSAAAGRLRLASSTLPLLPRGRVYFEPESGRP